jgi:mycothiol synthase
VRTRAGVLTDAPVGETPRTLSTTSWPGDTGAEDLLAASGLRPARYYLVMAMELSADAPSPVPPPEGVVLRAFRDDDAEGLYAAYLESFADHWGFEHPTPHEWWGERRESAASGFDPDLWHVATSGAEIVGFSVTRMRADSDGLTHGYVGDLGVRPAWRGRGLGEALLTRSLETYRDRGVPYVTLDVDAENTSGAVRLYTKVGMETRPSFTIWERPLPGCGGQPVARLVRA